MEAHEMIRMCTVETIVWFGGVFNAFDYSKKLPPDIQRYIFNTLLSPADLRNMSLVCKGWNEALMQWLHSIQSLFICDNSLDNAPCVIVGGKGIIVPSVPNKVLSAQDARKPIFSNKRSSIRLRIIRPTQVYGTLGPDESVEKTCEAKIQANRFDLVEIKFEVYYWQDHKADHNLCIATTFGEYWYPIRCMNLGSLSEIRQKIRGKCRYGEKPAGFCVYCGRKRKASGKNCSQCHGPSTTVNNAYKDWLDLNKPLTHVEEEDSI